MNGEPCRCGCGKIAGKYAHYLTGHWARGKKHSKEWVAKQSAGVVKAHKRGAFKEGCAKRKQKTLAGRSLCKCGCGKPVKKAAGIYASVGCIPLGMNSTERMNVLREMRDMEKLRSILSKTLTANIKKWKETGEYEAMRRECRTARGMPDHIAAKAWIVRDPFGNTYKFSNLAEWARQNEWRFEDDRTESKAPFWHRIAGGFSDLLKANGKSCSYRGWTAVSNLELEDGGKDLLARNCELLNPKKEKHNG